MLARPSDRLECRPITRARLAKYLDVRTWEVEVPPMRIGMQNGMVANIAVVGGLLLLLQNVRSW